VPFHVSSQVSSCAVRPITPLVVTIIPSYITLLGVRVHGFDGDGSVRWFGRHIIGLNAHVKLIQVDRLMDFKAGNAIIVYDM
jgi:hypothetical protein